jgi:hypothetical protein
VIPTAALRHRITIEPYEGSGALGPIYGDPITDVPARVVGKRRAVRTASGTDVIASAVCVIRPALDVRAESRVIHNGRRYVVLDVADSEDLTRPHHRELILDGPQ